MKFYGVRGKTFHSSATAAGRFEKDNNTPNSVEPVLDLTRIVESAISTAGATGIGGAIDMYLENDNDDEIVKSNRIIWKYTDATNGSEDSEIELWGMVGGVMTLFQTIGAGGITSYTDEQAQDAVGAMVDGSLTYVDGTPLLQRAALTGDVTASAGSNTTSIAAGVIVNADINGSAAIDATKIADGTVTSSEFQFINTLSSNAQTQIDSKQASLTNSAGLAAALSDETGTTLAVFSNTPTITTPVFSGAISTTDVAQNGTNASGTGYIPYIHQIYVRSDETLTNVNTDQNLFTNSAHDVITVQANTTYKFFMSADKTSGAVSHSVSLGFLPTTATVTNIEYTGFSWITAVGTQTASNTNFKTKATATTAINAAGANATNSWILWGTITIGATGGTITPQIKFSTDPGGTILLKAGSYFSIQAIGNNTFTEQGPIN